MCSTSRHFHLAIDSHQPSLRHFTILCPPPSHHPGQQPKRVLLDPIVVQAQIINRYPFSFDSFNARFLNQRNHSRTHWRTNIDPHPFKPSLPLPSHLLPPSYLLPSQVLHTRPVERARVELRHAMEWRSIHDGGRVAADVEVETRTTPLFARGRAAQRERIHHGHNFLRRLSDDGRATRAPSRLPTAAAAATVSIARPCCPVRRD